jgi:hypothetical protein
LTATQKEQRRSDQNNMFGPKAEILVDILCGRTVYKHGLMFLKFKIFRQF